MISVRRVVAVLAVLTTASFAPPAVALPGGTGQGISATIATPYGGQIRTFNVYVAPRVPTETPVPLLIVLHGLYLDPATAEASSGLDAVADSQDVAVVYPAGIHGSWNAGACCGDSRATQVDDVGYLIHVIHLVQKLRPLDLTRVYVAGFSNGGMMALRAVCDRPDVFAAAVAVGATLQTPCRGAKPLSALLVNGLRDTTVPYRGARYSRFLKVPLTPVPTTVGTLVNRSRCTANRVLRRPVYTERLYVGCAQRTSIDSVVLPAMGHRWPTAGHDRVDGGALAWGFLRTHRTGAQPS